MHEFPVAEQVEKLVSSLMSYAAVDKGEYSIWDEIHIRKDCQKCQKIAFFPPETESQGDQEADSQVGECIYHLLYPLIKEDNCENIYL